MIRDLYVAGSWTATSLKLSLVWSISQCTTGSEWKKVPVYSFLFFPPNGLYCARRDIPCPFFFPFLFFCCGVQHWKGAPCKTNSGCASSTSTGVRATPGAQSTRWTESCSPQRYTRTQIHTERQHQANSCKVTTQCSSLTLTMFWPKLVPVPRNKLNSVSLQGRAFTCPGIKELLSELCVILTVWKSKRRLEVLLHQWLLSWQRSRPLDAGETVA